MQVRRLLTGADVENLVQQLFSATRTEPVVAVTVSSRATEPYLDVKKLAAVVDPVPVVVLPTQELTWELTSLLPDELGVYGGAARIWWPGLTEQDQPYRHPLVFAYSADEGVRAAQRIVDEIERHEARALLAPASAQPARKAPIPRPYPVGEVVAGMVMTATPGGAEVEIAPGVQGWLVRRRRDAEAIVGKPVLVRVAGYDDDGVVLEQPPRSSGASLLKAEPAPVPSALPRPGPPRLGVAGEDIHSDLTSPVLIDLLRENAQLRRQLAEAEEEKTSADRQATDARHELTLAVKAAHRQKQELNRDLRALRDRISHLESQIRGTGRFTDAVQQLRHEVLVAWESACSGSDRDRWPLPDDYIVGPAFLPSVRSIEGITRAKIVEVCAEVLCGRAATQPGREVHPLRTGVGGDAAQRVRYDGAKAFRASLQVNTPSARRLHYWRLPDGRLELSKVGVHDDLTIA